MSRLRQLSERLRSSVETRSPSFNDLRVNPRIIRFSMSGLSLHTTRTPKHRPKQMLFICVQHKCPELSHDIVLEVLTVPFVRRSQFIVTGTEWESLFNVYEKIERGRVDDNILVKSFELSSEIKTKGYQYVE